MGEFIESNGGTGNVPVEPPKVFTNEFITSVVKKSLENGDMPIDHKLAFIGAVDESGIRAIISAQVMNKELVTGVELDVKIQAIAEYEWDGDKRAGAQFLFSVK